MLNRGLTSNAGTTSSQSIIASATTPTSSSSADAAVFVAALSQKNLSRWPGWACQTAARTENRNKRPQSEMNLSPTRKISAE